MPVAFVRSICKQRAQPSQLLRPGLGRSGEHDAHAACQSAEHTAFLQVDQMVNGPIRWFSVKDEPIQVKPLSYLVSSQKSCEFCSTHPEKTVWPDRLRIVEGALFS